MAFDWSEAVYTSFRNIQRERSCRRLKETAGMVYGMEKIQGQLTKN